MRDSSASSACLTVHGRVYAVISTAVSYTIPYHREKDGHTRNHLTLTSSPVTFDTHSYAKCHMIFPGKELKNTYNKEGAETSKERVFIENQTVYKGACWFICGSLVALIPIQPRNPITCLTSAGRGDALVNSFTAVICLIL